VAAAKAASACVSWRWGARQAPNRQRFTALLRRAAGRAASAAKLGGRLDKDTSGLPGSIVCPRPPHGTGPGAGSGAWNGLDAEAAAIAFPASRGPAEAARLPRRFGLRRWAPAAVGR